MAFAQNNIDRIRFDDPVTLLTKQNAKLLERGWAGYFSREIFTAINEQRFAVLFSEEKRGRYNASVNYIVSMLILKDMFRLKDSAVVQAVTFDLRFKYALNCSSIPNSPASAPSLARFRKKVAAYKRKTGIDLLEEEYNALGEPIRIMLSRYRIKPAAGSRIAVFKKATVKKVKQK